MRLVLRVLGYELCSIGLEDEAMEEEPPAGITGGGSMAFERDVNPLNASGEEPYWEDRGFGSR